MNRFKHSGTFGDLIYGLPLVKHFGGGEFYLHLNQIDWIGQHFYGSKPNPFHQGRLTQNDFDFMKDFMESQSYIEKFSVLLIQFRTMFLSKITKGDTIRTIVAFVKPLAVSLIEVPSCFKFITLRVPAFWASQVIKGIALTFKLSELI